MPQQFCPNLLTPGRACASRYGFQQFFVAAFSLRGFQPSMLSVLSAWGGGWGIFCPGCQQTLSKAHWRSCQWNAKGGKGHHEGGDAWGSIAYTKCRTCQPTPIWETDPHGLAEEPPEEEMEWLSALLARSSPARFMEFVTQWMEMIDAWTRK